MKQQIDPNFEICDLLEAMEEQLKKADGGHEIIATSQKLRWLILEHDAGVTGDQLSVVSNYRDLLRGLNE